MKDVGIVGLPFAGKSTLFTALTRAGSHGGQANIAVLPVAAVEQHGPHLPLGVDSYIAEAYLQLHHQHRSTWAFQVVLRPWAEKW